MEELNRSEVAATFHLYYGAHVLWICLVAEGFLDVVARDP